ncbi:conserved hypothetical protein [Trichinella spiralis]|uniref:hypothetical protein n=1 Tax=Trichinella spiralis TaxID=6334 RepID=UPI0001EFDDFC|nr:conserved hypothetical protein [Trichinella spiralis]
MKLLSHWLVIYKYKSHDTALFCKQRGIFMQENSPFMKHVNQNDNPLHNLYNYSLMLYLNVSAKNYYKL